MGKGLVLAGRAAGKWPLRGTGKGRSMSPLMGTLTKIGTLLKLCRSEVIHGDLCSTT